MDAGVVVVFSELYPASALQLGMDVCILLNISPSTVLHAALPILLLHMGFSIACCSPY